VIAALRLADRAVIPDTGELVFAGSARISSTVRYCARNISQSDAAPSRREQRDSSSMLSEKPTMRGWLSVADDGARTEEAGKMVVS
jgi:hypothetical protein